MDCLDDATRLERLQRAAEKGKRTGNLLEIWCCSSADQKHGDLPAALASLQEALTLAEPEGYIRLFVGEGPAMASLLRAAAKQDTASYVAQLLAAVNESGASAVPADRGWSIP